MRHNDWIVRHVTPYDQQRVSVVIELKEGDPHVGDVVAAEDGSRFSVVSLSLGGPPSTDRRAIVLEPMDGKDLSLGCRLRTLLGSVT